MMRGTSGGLEVFYRSERVAAESTESADAEKSVTRTHANVVIERTSHVVEVVSMTSTSSVSVSSRGGEDVSELVSSATLPLDGEDDAYDEQETDYQRTRGLQRAEAFRQRLDSRIPLDAGGRATVNEVLIREAVELATSKKNKGVEVSDFDKENT